MKRSLLRVGAWVEARVEWWRFVFRNRLIWFLQPTPLFEFDTRIYIGRPGMGKTLFATRDAVRLLRKGYRVCANYSVRDPKTGLEAEVITSWYDVLRIAVEAFEAQRPTVFVIDEVNLWAPSRFYKNTPGWWLALMAQRRHLGIGFICTAQRFNRVEIVLRELVNTIVFCSKLQIGRLRLFGAKAVDPTDVEAAAAEGGGDKVRAAAARERLGFGIPVWIPGYIKGAYSTAEVIAVEEWGEEEDTKERIAQIMEDARRLGEVVYIPAVVDEWRVISERLEICAACDQRPGCEDRFNAVLGPVCSEHSRFEQFFIQDDEGRFDEHLA